MDIRSFLRLFAAANARTVLPKDVGSGLAYARLTLLVPQVVLDEVLRIRKVFLIQRFPAFASEKLKTTSYSQNRVNAKEYGIEGS